MQVSYNLLKEYVDIEMSPDDLADRLSLNGIVAEHKKKMFDRISGVVVGEIKDIQLHSNNKNLSICKVDIANKELDVICGAKNMSVGDKVPFAMESATLPGLGKIERKNINGFLSRGMICSASELGIEKSKSPGVLILSDNSPLGININDLENIKDDVIFDFEIFSNRPDLMSIIGIAREISVFSGKDLHIPSTEIIEYNIDINEKISVQVKDKDLCPRYSGRIIQDLKIKESPFWLRWKMYLLGIRPISNVVDVTNYVMMETGQPLHAFDLNYIHGSRIIIRRALPGEKFNTLDGVERELSEENLIIADKDRAIALAGVMGGENSEIKEDTKDVFLESAYFNPVNNRRTSRFFSLRTDASNRFEKGIDPDGQIYALNRAASLINQITPGNILSGVIDQTHKTTDRKTEIKLNFSKLNKIIGVDIAKEDDKSKIEIIRILERLGCRVTEKNNFSIKVIPPTFRGDVQRDVDIIEEIAKIYGYEKIPNTLFKSTVIQKGISDEQKMLDKINSLLISCGMHQTINYSIITPEYFDWMNLPEAHEMRNTISLSNPLIQDQTIMRTTLLPGLLRVVQRNVNHKLEEIKIFETGKIFLKQNYTNNRQLPLEKINIAGAITKIGRGNIWEKAENWDMFYLKGILESLFSSLRIREVSYLKESFPAFDSERSGLITVKEQKIGIFGKINKSTAETMDIPEDVFLFEINFSELFPYIDQQIVFKQLPKYPSLNRDIAITVPEDVVVDEINKAIKKVNPDIIKKVELFDIFRGKQIKSGHKSIAFSIIFQAEDRTLTDEEVDKMMESVKIQLKTHFKADLRK